MNLTKALIAGIAAAIATWLADYVMHGVMMASTYAKYPIFSQEQPNPFMFLFVGVFIGVAAALLFAKTPRMLGRWGEGGRERSGSSWAWSLSFRSSTFRL